MPAFYVDFHHGAFEKMNFEPQKFFVGLVDFFSILMPGAILAYVVKDCAAEIFSGMNAGFPLDRTESGIVFLFASYLLGHFVYLISALLDEFLYRPLRKVTDLGQMDLLIKGKKPLARWLRKLASSHFLFGKGADNAVLQAERMKARALQCLDADSAVNAFQWCKIRLAKDFPSALLTVQRFEADAKFFRSLVVVLAITTIVFAHRKSCSAAIVSFAGIFPALWLYIDQRFKSIEQAFWSVISTKEIVTGLPATAPQPDGLVHAGGVVYRQTTGGVKYLLVQASKDREKWVLPKGHVEPGEDPRITAVREIKEETGHWARLECWLTDGLLDETVPSSPRVRWFLLELAEEPVEFCDNRKHWRPEFRQHRWFVLTEAQKKASFPEARKLLEEASSRIKQAGKSAS